MSAALRAVKANPVVDVGDVFSTHVRYVAKLAYRMLGRDDLVDDLVQDVFVAALKGLDALHDPEAIRGWLARVTVRLASRRLKRQRFVAFLGFDDDDSNGEADVVCPSASPEQQVLLAQVYRVLEKVPVDERLAWTLRYVEGAQLDEVATWCGCSLATAKRRIGRAAELIERHLDAK